MDLHKDSYIIEHRIKKGVLVMMRKWKQIGKRIFVILLTLALIGSSTDLNPASTLWLAIRPIP